MNAQWDNNHTVFSPCVLRTWGLSIWVNLTAATYATAGTTATL